jgi:Predicted nucleic-acid-binding protein containing a Zn-ribbon
VTAGPVPVPTPLTRPFWDGSARGELLIQHCDACGRSAFPPRPHCASCAEPLRWVRATGEGTLVTFAINHRPDPSFEVSDPQILAVVELDEGVRMATSLIGLDPDPDAIAIGMAVSVTFIPRGGLRLPVFAPQEPA